MKQAIGKFVEGQANIVKAIGQSGEDIGELATARGFMRSDELKITAADLLIKFNIGRTSKTPALRVLVKNSADEKRIISNVRPEKKGLFTAGASQRDQHVGNIFVDVILDLVRRL